MAKSLGVIPTVALLGSGYKVCMMGLRNVTLVVHSKCWAFWHVPVKQSMHKVMHGQLDTWTRKPVLCRAAYRCLGMSACPACPLKCGLSLLTHACWSILNPAEWTEAVYAVSS